MPLLDLVPVRLRADRRRRGRSPPPDELPERLLRLPEQRVAGEQLSRSLLVVRKIDEGTGPLCVSASGFSLWTCLPAWKRLRRHRPCACGTVRLTIVSTYRPRAGRPAMAATPPRSRTSSARKRPDRHRSRSGELEAVGAQNRPGGSAPRCFPPRRGRPSWEPLSRLLAHHPDLLAGVVILRLVLDRIGADVVDPEQRPETELDVDDPRLSTSRAALPSCRTSFRCTCTT